MLLLIQRIPLVYIFHKNKIYDSSSGSTDSAREGADIIIVCKTGAKGVYP